MSELQEPFANMDSGEFKLLLGRMRDGDEAAANQAVTVVYDELKRLARSYMSRERSGHTLQPTALVNEAYMRLLGGSKDIPDRKHFMAFAAVIMRRVLVDHYREKKALKRGEAGVRITLTDHNLDLPGPSDVDVLVIHEALTDLEAIDPRAAKVVEHKFFGGYTNEEIALLLETSIDKVRRDWTFARAFLFSRLSPENPGK
jgi:RNA polymerase sigma factor (TIGR02999 family)